MEMLFILIPVSIVLIALAGAIFLWAVNNNQFEHLDKHGFDILDDDSGDKS